MVNFKLLLVHVKAPVLFCSLNILRSKNKVSRKCIQVIIDYLRWGTHEKKKIKEKKGKKKTQNTLQRLLWLVCSLIREKEKFTNEFMFLHPGVTERHSKETASI